MNRHIEADIERYLAGEMDRAEAGELRRRLAADPVRARLLAKDETILTAMQIDRDRVPVEHTAARMRAMAALESGTPSQGARAARERSYDLGSVVTMLSLVGLTIVGAVLIWFSVGEPQPIGEPAPIKAPVLDTTRRAPLPAAGEDTTASYQAAEQSAGIPQGDTSSSASVPVTERSRRRVAASGTERRSGGREPDAPQSPAVSSPVPPQEPPPPIYNDPVARGSIQPNGAR